MKKTKIKKDKKVLLNEYFKKCDEVADFFVDKYYKNIEVEKWWVAGAIGGTLFINDNYYDMEDMVDCLRYNYSVDKMFDYYDYAIEEFMEGTPPICIRGWVKLKTNK